MPFKIEGLLDRIGFGKRNTVGFAYSGGGARGFTHIGALMAFEAFGIRPDIQSGVSAGAIAAVLYGAGLTPKEMAECFGASGKFGDFTELTLPKESFFKLNKFGKLLESWLPVSNLEELKIPTVVCATNFDKGTSVGWSRGEIVPRVLASCSIPIIFQPVQINGINYVDGGVLRNLPAWAIRRHCKTLYGLNCSPLSNNFAYKPSLTQITLRTYNLMSKANTLQDLSLCDYVIQSREARQFRTFDLKALEKAIIIGYDCTSRVLEAQLRAQ